VEQLTLHCNRAAAYLQLRQYVDCVEECSTILRAVPDHPKALARRAKAYDATAQYGKALKDLDALTASAGDAGEDLTALHVRHPIPAPCTCPGPCGLRRTAVKDARWSWQST
jgi:hypothetical protein